jgi:hypothetical protein
MKQLLKKLFTGWDDLKSDLLLKIFILYLAISQLYYSYRYFLGYGSSRTSPTARDTPLEFQLPRYLVTLAFYLLVLIVFFWRYPNYRQRLLEKVKSHKIISFTIVFFLFYLSLGLLKFNFDLTNFSYREIVKIFFFIPVAIVPLALLWKDKFVEILFKFLNLSLIFQTLGFIAVYLTYVLTGHPPAQAYPGSMVRFGGIWDDPNGLAFFLLIPLFAYLSLNQQIQRKYRKTVYLATLVISVMLFLTLSLTAWVAMAVGLALLLFLRREKFILKNIAVVAATFLVLAISSPYSKDFLAFKTASLLARIGIVYEVGGQGGSQITPGGYGDYVSDSEILASLAKDLAGALGSFDQSSILRKSSVVLFGFSGRPIFSENFYLLLIFNYGLIGLGIFLSLLAISVRRSLALAKRAAGFSRNLGLFSFVFLVASAVGLIALPYLSIYPVGVYVWLVLVISLFLKR